MGEHRLPGVVLHPFGETGDRIRRAERAAACARAIAADVVHDFGTGVGSNVLHLQYGSRVADRRANLRALAWPQGLVRRFGPRSRREDGVRRRLQDRQIAEARVVIAPSRGVRADLVALHGAPPARIRVVPNAVDLRRFDPGSRERQRAATRERLGFGTDVVFVFVAHNWRLKGLWSAIRALSMLGREGRRARLMVVGRGPAASPLRFARRLGVGDRCVFVGDTHDVAPYLAAADVNLHPTFFDPCSLSVLEAWASGLPVVTTSVNGTAELMMPGREGLIVDDPGDVVALARAMRSMMDDERRRAMAGPARRLAEANTVELWSRRIAEVYGEVVIPCEPLRRAPEGSPAEPRRPRSIA